MYKNCVICGKEFFTKPSKSERKCCSKKCAGVYRKTTYGCLLSEETRLKNGQILKERWKDPEFRKKKIEYMRTNNPVYREGVIEKANKARLMNGKLPNNFKYGNGKMSEYESKAWEMLEDLGFVYNKGINTREIRKLYPDKHIAWCYKPDFLHRSLKICIEIDGKNHATKYIKQLDKKKDETLKLLGYTVIRFTHDDIDKGKLKEYVDKWQN